MHSSRTWQDFENHEDYGVRELRLPTEQTQSDFPAIFDLANLNGSNGFRVGGIDAGDQSGFSVSSAGDINGDGFDDIIIGARYAGPDGHFTAGESYIIFGSGSSFSANFALTSLDGTNGFRIDGIDPGDQSGSAVSSAGDINGDGFDDIIIGADRAGSGGGFAGESYVIFGSGSGFSASIDLASLNGSNGFRIDGIDVSDRSGASVSSAGDVNGDGFDDIIIGAFGADPNGNSAAGESYVLFGSGSAFGSSIDLGDLDGTNGFRIDGIDAFDFSGGSVSSAGDVNGDGFDDIIIGAIFAAPGGRSDAGESYVVFGSGSGFAASIYLADLDGTNGFRIGGVDNGDQSGFSVSSAGDVNGDGFDDIIVGAYHADSGGEDSAGESYVVFGSGNGFSASLDLATLDGTNGFRIDGIDAQDNSGFSVSSAGDVNGDGFDDIIIGARGADPDGNSFAGESYVVFGSGGGFTASLDLATLDGTNGFRINGVEAFDASGTSVSAAGDVNGDGFDDIIIGALAADSGYDGEVGESYVIFGVAPQSAVTRIGSEANQVIRGGAFDDMLSGLGGDDVLIGEAGNDTLLGDDGDDTLEGGSGEDLLRGGDGADSIVGGANNDSVIGGSGADIIFGNGGNDTLRGGRDDDVIAGGNGNDRLSGEAGNDTLVGGDGDDTLGGSSGDDSMVGGEGDDTYFLQQAGDEIVENADEGYDRVFVYLDGITAPDNVEELRLVGPVAREGFGNALDNVLAGGGGSDTLHGGDGDDTLAGNGGGDELHGDNGKDRLLGGGGADTLFGGANDDRLQGEGDNDILKGGGGADTLFGGAGRDTLTGGGGADRFAFVDGDVSGVLTQADRITDFSQGDGDRIQLSGIDADTTIGGTQNFTFIGTDAFSGAAGELRYQQIGGETRIFGDTDGDTVADFIIRLESTVTLVEADFFL
ncbi:FG-GAP repeat protein [Parasphingopyxis marina]|uniref:FG-GAP repeat protein n=1 Tax=Parasphingopyxis marina TaxID=2761622 RepID=A0A842HVK4_9SPHN|nr:FG-GAP repeat protein [Parasphingopyxis marina]MBC2776533.1 FG-GAP repeat protein [Parasphingopyxis marina]